jgi:hypothetical protein
VPGYLVPIPGAGHGDFGTAADGHVAAFFDRHLNGKEVQVPTAPIEFRKR